MNKYYTHVSRFSDNTAYLVVNKYEETEIVLKNGKSMPGMRYPHDYCREQVRNGDWKEISATEAAALLDEKETVFILDSRAVNSLNAFGVSLAGIDSISLDDLLGRVYDAGVWQGEVNAKRIVENALDNI